MPLDFRFEDTDGRTIDAFGLVFFLIDAGAASGIAEFPEGTFFGSLARRAFGQAFIEEADFVGFAAKILIGTAARLVFGTIGMAFVVEAYHLFFAADFFAFLAAQYARFVAFGHAVAFSEAGLFFCTADFVRTAARTGIAEAIAAVFRTYHIIVAAFTQTGRRGLVARKTAFPRHLITEFKFIAANAHASRIRAGDALAVFTGVRRFTCLTWIGGNDAFAFFADFLRFAFGAGIIGIKAFALLADLFGIAFGAYIAFSVVADLSDAFFFFGTLGARTVCIVADFVHTDLLRFAFGAGTLGIVACVILTDLIGLAFTAFGIFCVAFSRNADLVGIAIEAVFVFVTNAIGCTDFLAFTSAGIVFVFGCLVDRNGRIIVASGDQQK